MEPCLVSCVGSGAFALPLRLQGGRSVGRGSTGAGVLGHLPALGPEGLWGTVWEQGWLGRGLGWRPDSGEQEVGVQDGAVLSAELGQQEGVSHHPMGGCFMGGELPVPGRI